MRYLRGKGTQTTYEHRCKICGKMGTSRNMTYSYKYKGYVHRKCKKKKGRR